MVQIAEKVSDHLQHYNFVLLEDSKASYYRDKYLPDRPEKGYEFYRVALHQKLKTDIWSRHRSSNTYVILF
jgi:hypothetical protein